MIVENSYSRTSVNALVKVNFVIPHSSPKGRNEATMKYTQTTLDKLEAVVEESGYVLRYERGNFQSGYCILESKKVVVLNKFLQIEGRINTMLDLIPQLEINQDALSEESKKLYAGIISKLETEQNGE